MNKVKQAFENIWKVKRLRKDYKEEDKELYYELFMDGYGCALIDLKEVSNLSIPSIPSNQPNHTIQSIQNDKTIKMEESQRKIGENGENGEEGGVRRGTKQKISIDEEKSISEDFS